MFDCVPRLSVRIRALADARDYPAECCERAAADALDLAITNGDPIEISSTYRAAELVYRQMQTEN